MPRKCTGLTAALLSACLVSQLPSLCLSMQVQPPGVLEMVHDVTEGGAAPGDSAKAQSCTPTPIEIDMCMDINYNVTATQLYGYSKQSDVSLVLKELESLVRIPCAPFMKLFVCAMHLPLCHEAQALLVRPCKEFCLRIQSLCAPLLTRFGHAWPQTLSCDGLANEREAQSKLTGLCLRPLSSEFDRELQRLRDSAAIPGRPNTAPSGPLPPMPPAQTPPVASSSPTLQATPSAPRRLCSAAEVRIGHQEAAATMAAAEGGGGGGGLCAQRCSANLLYSQEDKNFASAWMLIWSVVCLAATGLAVATFALDSERFRFPERPIVWVAACYLLFASGHLLRASLGPEVACARHSETAALHRVTRHAGHWCAVVFLLLYFSSTAGCCWWLLLTVCWYLCAARKWAHEALAHRTMWLHVFAWGCPLLLTVVLLVLHRIEADELTHLCVVDASNRANLLIFIIAPVSLCLLVGLGFLISALCSTLSVRHSLKWSGNSSFRRLEKLMTKIGLFSFLFLLPTVCVLAATIYEYMERDRWTASLEKVLSNPRCVNASGLLSFGLSLRGGSGSSSAGEELCHLEHRPSAAFHMLKIFMSLATGLPSGLIVWFNCKSLGAWQGSLAKICAGACVARQPLPQQLQLQQQHQQLVAGAPESVLVQPHAKYKMRQQLQLHHYPQGSNSSSKSLQHQQQHQQQPQKHQLASGRTCVGASEL